MVALFSIFKRLPAVPAYLPSKPPQFLRVIPLFLFLRFRLFVTLVGYPPPCSLSPFASKLRPSSKSIHLRRPVSSSTHLELGRFHSLSGAPCPLLVSVIHPSSLLALLFFFPSTSLELSSSSFSKHPSPIAIARATSTTRYLTLAVRRHTCRDTSCPTQRLPRPTDSTCTTELRFARRSRRRYTILDPRRHR